MYRGRSTNSSCQKLTRLKIAKLPSKGLNPDAIPDGLISNDDLVYCFGTLKKNSALLSKYTLIQHEDIIHLTLNLTQTLDGHKILLNSMLGKSVQSSICALHLEESRELGWVAKGKHRNQI